MNLPDKIKIFDVTYTIDYFDNPADVDRNKRESLWGQVDFWTRTIRIYKNDRESGDIMQTVWHEVLHAVCNSLHIETEGGELENDEKTIDLLAVSINTILLDNGWLK